MIYLMKDIIFSNCNNDINNILKSIEPAKSRYLLEVFGGNMSIIEYRKNFIYINNNNTYKYLIIKDENNIEEKIKNSSIKKDYKLKR